MRNQSNLSHGERLNPASKFFEQRRIQRLGLACENDFGLIQRNHRAINVSLRVRPEVNGELAVLLVTGCVKPVVMKVAHWKLEFMRSALHRVTLAAPLANSTRRLFIISDVAG